MNRKEHLLAIVAEECNEVGQRAHKAMRFGINEVQDGQNLDNAARLIYEFNDLVGVMRMLHNEGHIPYPFDGKMQDAKIAKVEQFLLLSKEMGTLDVDCNCDNKVEVCEICYRNQNVRKNKPEPNVDTVSPAY
jgi:hypothetical protein